MTEASELAEVLKVRVQNMEARDRNQTSENNRLLHEANAAAIKVNGLQAEVTRLLREAKANNPQYQMTLNRLDQTIADLRANVAHWERVAESRAEVCDSLRAAKANNYFEENNRLQRQLNEQIEKNQVQLTPAGYSNLLDRLSTAENEHRVWKALAQQNRAELDKLQDESTVTSLRGEVSHWRVRADDLKAERDSLRTQHAKADAHTQKELNDLVAENREKGHQIDKLIIERACLIDGLGQSASPRQTFVVHAKPNSVMMNCQFLGDRVIVGTLKDVEIRIINVPAINLPKGTTK
jgi:chromosome segregation ATPase